MDSESEEIQEGIENSLLLFTTLGPDLTDSERQGLIDKAYISSCAIRDFLNHAIDLETFLDVQEFCLTQPMDNYLKIVEVNLEELSFAELLAT